MIGFSLDDVVIFSRALQSYLVGAVLFYNLQDLAFCAFYSEFFLLVSILFLFFFFILYRKERNDFFFTHYIFGFSILFIFLNLKITFSTLFYTYSIKNDFFFVNSSIIKVKLVILFFTLFFLLLGWDYFYNRNLQLFEFPLLILILTLGALIIISSNNLFVLFLGLEMQSLVFYILAGLKKGSKFSVEASLKYFILGSYSSCLFLLGVSLLYGFLGSVSFFQLSRLLTFDINLFEIDFFFIILGFFFILVSLFFKIAIFPFHFWIADVYEGSPTLVTFYFATLPKLVILFVFFKLYLFSFNVFLLNFIFVFQLLSFFSLLYGAFLSLYQFKFKRLIAFSAISHMGYILLSFSFFDMHGLSSAIFYMIIYIFISFNFFTLLLSFSYSFRKENFVNVDCSNLRHLVELKNITNSSSIFLTNLSLAIIFAVIIFTLAGLPPFCMFFSKFLVFYLLFIKYSPWFGFFIMILSILSAFYYIRVLRFVFFSSNSTNYYFIIPPTKFQAFFLVFSFFVNLFFPFFIGPLFFFVENFVFSFYLTIL